jgi:hypothetical protein
MRSVSSVTVTTAALAAALMLSLPPSAEAGRACNELGLSSPCIRSNDLKARLNLDEDGRNARLRLRDADGENAVELDASSGNLTNLFSNDENASNGVVKAWARINADGTIDACWRCNKDPAETSRISDGFYEVDFTPLATDISGRPRTGIVEGALGSLVVNNNNADLSTVSVSTFFTSGLDDRSFILVIY